jgi:hypothetical protein
MMSLRRPHLSRNGWLILLTAIVVLGAVGCSSPKSQYGSRKEDWAKTAPPPQWRGPGQPGGPPGASLSGPAAKPPANVIGQAAPPGPGSK